MKLVNADLKKQKPGMIINFVLDKSGSMLSRQDETITAFNQYLGKQQETELAKEGKVFFSLTQFADEAKVIYAAKPLGEVEPLNRNTYSPEGFTALHDAIGYTVQSVEEAIKGWKKKPAILVVILTDGQENYSKKFHNRVQPTQKFPLDNTFRTSQTKTPKKTKPDPNCIRTIIENKTKEGNWTFVFLGAELNTQEVSQSLGISGANTLQYDPNQIVQTMATLSKRSAVYAANVLRGDMSTAGFFAAEDEKDQNL